MRILLRGFPRQQLTPTCKGPRCSRGCPLNVRVVWRRRRHSHQALRSRALANGFDPGGRRDFGRARTSLIRTRLRDRVWRCCWKGLLSNKRRRSRHRCGASVEERRLALVSFHAEVPLTAGNSPSSRNCFQLQESLVAKATLSGLHRYRSIYQHHNIASLQSERLAGVAYT
jgi:hypothetical protein